MTEIVNTTTNILSTNGRWIRFINFEELYKIKNVSFENQLIINKYRNYPSYKIIELINKYERLWNDMDLDYVIENHIYEVMKYYLSEILYRRHYYEHEMTDTLRGIWIDYGLNYNGDLQTSEYIESDDETDDE